MILSFFAQSRMNRLINVSGSFMLSGTGRNLLNCNLICICQPKSQLIPMDLQFHRVAHWGKLNHRHFRSRNHSHIQEMLA